MGGRPIFHAGFGQLLAQLRERKGWSQSDAGRFGAKLHAGITRQVLVHLEKGKAKDPDPEILHALAELYGATYKQIAAALVADKYGVDLLGQQAGKDELYTPASPLGGALDPDTARLLGQLSTAYDTLAVDLLAVHAHISAAVDRLHRDPLGRQVHPAPAKAPSRRRAR